MTIEPGSKVGTCKSDAHTQRNDFRKVLSSGPLKLRVLFDTLKGRVALAKYLTDTVLVIGTRQQRVDSAEE
jgi:hypothetical protein